MVLIFELLEKFILLIQQKIVNLANLLDYNFYKAQIVLKKSYACFYMSALSLCRFKRHRCEPLSSFDSLSVCTVSLYCMQVLSLSLSIRPLHRLLTHGDWQDKGKNASHLLKNLIFFACENFNVLFVLLFLQYCCFCKIFLTKS